MRSMTGFGSGSAAIPEGVVTAEVRSLNSRFLDLSVRLPGLLASQEAGVRREVSGRLRRGKVDVTIRFEAAEGTGSAYRLNRPLLDLLVAESGRQLRAQGCADAVRPELLMQVTGVLEPVSDGSFAEAAAKAVLAAVNQSLDRLIADREREGASMASAMREVAGRLRAEAARVSAGRRDVVERYRTRLLARVAELLGSRAGDVDSSRLEVEVALFADKADISEECARLEGHLDQLDGLLAKGGEAVGRPLDFLAQEIVREINTLGSKSRELEIARSVLAMKNDAETLKELLANVE